MRVYPIALLFSLVLVLAANMAFAADNISALSISAKSVTSTRKDGIRTTRYTDVQLNRSSASVLADFAARTKDKTIDAMAQNTMTITGSNFVQCTGENTNIFTLIPGTTSTYSETKYYLADSVGGREIFIGAITLSGYSMTYDANKQEVQYTGSTTLTITQSKPSAEGKQQTISQTTLTANSIRYCDFSGQIFLEGQITGGAPKELVMTMTEKGEMVWSTCNGQYQIFFPATEPVAEKAE